MDKLHAIRTFIQIVECGSLTAAADELRKSLPAVVRTLGALEAELDVRLLNRTTRRIALTDEGREYYERCKSVLAELDEAEAALSQRRVTPKGRLRLTSSVMFGRLHVAPIVTEFIVKYPAVQVELLLLDRVVDLVEEGIDAAVRIGELPDSSLVAIAVGQTRRVFCASRAYLKRGGVPQSPADMAEHRCVNFTGLAGPAEWSFGDGATAYRTSITPAFTTNQIDTALDACLQGVGIGQFLSYQVQALLDQDKLERVLVEFEPAPLPIHIVYPHSRLLSSNVRRFIDWAAPRLRTRMKTATA
jgi:DNA-binding transcriptional LysR family regulator